MKKAVMIGLLMMSSVACASGPHYHGAGWVAPLVGGIAVGAIISNAYNNPPVQYVPVPVPVPPPVYYHQAPSFPYGLHHEPVYDSYCGCYKSVLVPN